MTLTREQVAETCGRIEAGLDAFDADADKAASLHQAWADLRWLRGQYSENRALLMEFVDRLKPLRGRLMDALRASRAAMASEYVKAAQAVAAWRGHQEMFRDLLMELATADSLVGLDAPEGHIEVRHDRTVSLPAAETDEHRELVAILAESGQWEHVANISRAKLAKALGDGQFPPDQAGRIARLCPVEPTCRLMARSPGR